MERWKIISEFPEFVVSSHGRIKRAVGRERTYAGRLIAPYTNKKGYSVVRLHTTKGRYCRFVSVLVAKAFIPNPKHKPEVNHKNGRQKWNNRVSNLEWATDKEQIQHAIATGLFRSCKGSKNGNAQINAEAVREIRRLRAAGVPQKVVMAKFKLSKAQVSRIFRRLSWTHL